MCVRRPAPGVQPRARLQPLHESIPHMLRNDAICSIRGCRSRHRNWDVRPALGAVDRQHPAKKQSNPSWAGKAAAHPAASVLRDFIREVHYHADEAAHVQVVVDRCLQQSRSLMSSVMLRRCGQSMPCSSGFGAGTHTPDVTHSPHLGFAQRGEQVAALRVHRIEQQLVHRRAMAFLCMAPQQGSLVRSGRDPRYYPQMRPD